MIKTNVQHQTFAEPKLKWAMATLCVLAGWVAIPLIPSDAPPSGKETFVVFLAAPLLFLFFLYNFFRPPQLTIGPNGYAVKGLLSGRSGEWVRASDFWHKKPVIGKGLVQFKQCDQLGVWRKIYMPSNFGRPPQDLTKIFNTYRDQALRLKQDFPA